MNISGGSGNKSKLMLELVPGFHTQNLVAEIFRLAEAKSKVFTTENSFEWLEKYKSKGK